MHPIAIGTAVTNTNTKETGFIKDSIQVVNFGQPVYWEYVIEGPGFTAQVLSSLFDDGTWVVGRFA